MQPQPPRLIATFLVPGGLLVAVLLDIARLFGVEELPRGGGMITLLVAGSFVAAYLLGLTLYDFSYYGFQRLHRCFREIVMRHDVESRKIDRNFSNLLDRFGVGKEAATSTGELKGTFVSLRKPDRLGRRIKVLLGTYVLPVLPSGSLRGRLWEWAVFFEDEGKKKQAKTWSYHVFNGVRTVCYLHSGSAWVGRIEYTWRLFRLSLTSKWAAFIVATYCTVVLAVIGVLEHVSSETWAARGWWKVYLAGAVMFWFLSQRLNKHSWNRHRGFARDCVLGFAYLWWKVNREGEPASTHG